MNEKVSITLFSFNVNGFTSSEQFLNSMCCNNANFILCLQEHWLRPAYKRMKSVNQLRTIHPSFDGYGVSAMKKVHNDTITKGRPYGGTGFVFSKRFTPFLQPVLQYENERILVMKIIDAECVIMIINVYFPFKKSGDEHRIEYLELLGSIESIMLANPTARFVIAGDFNYNIYDDGQLMSPIINKFVTDNNLVCTHSLDPNFSCFMPKN